MNQQFYQVGGSLPANSKSYIKREADDKLYNYLKEGKYCYVLNARQVGKSSLRVHTSKRLKEDGYNCVNIDLTSIGSDDITADEWYFSFLLYIIEELELDEDEFVEWWDDNDKLTVVNRFAKTFDKFILKIIDKKIVIFIDEVDSILGIKKDFSADDFFAVIRTFYNLRSEDERYNRVTFALFGVATPEDLMRDSTRTPFNIAHSIKITQFKLDESLSLVDGLNNQSVDSHKILEKIFEWTGGTPYLTQKILNYISSNPIEHIADIDKIVDTLFIQENFNEINISNIQKRIISSEQYSVKMLYLIGELINEGKIKADDGKLEQIYLKLSGLVKEVNGELLYTNKIYKEIFNQKWLDESIGKIDRPLSQDLQRWLELDKSSSALLKGKVLDEVNSWAFGRDDLTGEESEYLRLSMIEVQQETLENERKKAQTKQIKHLTVFSFLLILFAFGLGYLYLEAEKQTKIAQIERDRAIEQERLIAEKKELLIKDKLKMKQLNQLLEKEKLKLDKLEELLDGTLFSETLNDSEKNYKEALIRYIDLSKDNPKKYKPKVAKTYQNLGLLYNLQNKFTESIKYYNKALSIYGNLTNSCLSGGCYIDVSPLKNNQAKVSKQIAEVYVDINETKQAQDYYKQSLKIYTELENKKSSIKTLQGLADLYKKTGNKEKAKIYYSKALEIIKELENKDEQNQYTNDLAKLALEIDLNELDKKKEKLPIKIKEKKKAFTQEGWVYLGEFERGKWKEKSFDFNNDTDPLALVGTKQTMTSPLLRIREFGYGTKVIDKLKRGDKVQILFVESVFSGYMWAKVKY